MKPLSFALKISIWFSALVLLIIVANFYLKNRIEVIAENANRVQQLRLPMTLVVQDMQNGISQSLAALRGYMLLGNDSLKQERLAIWSQQIKPQMAQLKKFSIKGEKLSQLLNFDNLQMQMNSLEQIEFKIESMVESEDNLPAIKLFKTSTLLKTSNLIESITQMIELEVVQKASNQRKRLLKDMADFRASIALSKAALESYLLTLNQEFIAVLNKQQQKNSAAFFKITQMKNLLSSAQLVQFSKIEKNRPELEQSVEAVIAIASGPKENMGQFMLRTEAMPLSEKLIAGLKRIAQSQKSLLNQDFLSHQREIQVLEWIIVSLFILGALLIAAMPYFVSRIVTRPINKAVEIASQIGQGSTEVDTRLKGSLEMQKLGLAFASTTRLLSERSQKIKKRRWIEKQLTNLMEISQGVNEIEQLAKDVLSYLAGHLEVGFGAFYLSDLVTQLSFDDDQSAPEFSGELNHLSEKSAVGLNLLASYAYQQELTSPSFISLGEGLIGQCAVEKKQIVLSELPVNYLKIKSALGESSSVHLLLQPIVFGEQILAVIELASFKPFSIDAREMLQKMAFNLSISMNKILYHQQTKNLLKTTQEQAQTLKSQAQEMQSQQEELLANNELMVKQSKQLSQASRYKTEFLAKMSHELRTPLNSLLILAKSLGQNKTGNLSQVQLEDIMVIQQAGQSLLELINDILDLSKVEAGQLKIQFEKVFIQQLALNLQRLFERIASDQSIQFEIKLQSDLPKWIVTDGFRLEQVLKNFLSNALKYTQQGSVILQIFKPDKSVALTRNKIPSNLIGFSVIDTGCGIKKEQQQSIFEAFAQETDSDGLYRQGSGLGLSISKEIAELLGGEIQLQSELGKGSIFTLYLPCKTKAPNTKKQDSANMENKPISMIDLANLNGILAANHGNIETHRRDEIFNEKRTFKENNSNFFKESGLSNPLSLLLVEDQQSSQQAIQSLLQNEQIHLQLSSSWQQALTAMETQSFDGVILDLGLPDISTDQLLEELVNRQKTLPPLIIYTGKTLSNEDQVKLNPLAQDVILKCAESPERLVDAVTLLSMQSGSEFSSQAKKYKKHPKSHKQVLSDSHILLVDDDMRNLYALSKQLMEEGAEVTMAENGKHALELTEGFINKRKNISIILMDLMMPEMDGYETMQRIRLLPELQTIPIIVLSAKSMPDEKERCLQVGASDYLAKPIEFKTLLKKILDWLNKTELN